MCLPEGFLTVLTFARVDLGGVLPGHQGLQIGLALLAQDTGQIAVEMTEVSVHGAAPTRFRTPLPQFSLVVIHRFSFGGGQGPAQGTAAQAPPRLALTAVTAAQAQLYSLHQVITGQDRHQSLRDLGVELLIPLEAGVQILLGGPAFPRLQPAPELAAERQAFQASEFLATGVARHRLEHHAAGEFTLLIAPDRPDLLQLRRGPAAPLELLGEQHIGFDRQTLAKLLQQPVADQIALNRCALGQQWMLICPTRLILHTADQIRVVDLQQLQLFKVRVGEPPPPPQVDHQSVFQDFAQGLAKPALGVGDDILLLDEVISLQPQRFLRLQGQGLQAELLVRLGLQGGHQTGTQLQHPHEVVEMAGLERGVLAVIAERQQLPGVVGQFLRREVEQLAEH